MSMEVTQRGEPLLSVVIPIYNEQATLSELYRRLTHVLSENLAGLAHEIVFVNDGSTDASIQILRELHADDSAVKVVNLSRNFGHQAALTAGLDYAKGDAVVCMDGDLQDHQRSFPPSWRGGGMGMTLSMRCESRARKVS